MPLFALALLLLILSAVAYPLCQAASTGGVIYYANGNDEATYLQYDFARAAASALRPSQLLVVAGHQLGLSGGWVNFLADLVVPAAFVLFGAAAFRQLGWSPARARLSGLAIATVPVLFSAVNPLLKAWSRWCVHTGWSFWWNMVEQPTPALLRTPEPQLSWMLILASVVLALRLRTAWPVLLAAPFAYPFVGVPAAFVALAWELKRRWPLARWPVAGPLFAAYLALGLAATLVYHFLTTPRIRLLVLDTHLPMGSLSSLLALALYMWCRHRLPPGQRFVALAAALAPLAACNVQVLSGHIGMPVNFEQFAGIFSITVVLLLGAANRPRLIPAFVAAGYALLLWSNVGLFRENASLTARLPFDARLARALQEDPRHTAINDVPMSSILNLAYPREATTALAYNQFFPAVADQYWETYLCVRARILREHGDDTAFRQALADLDHCYLLGGQDYVMANLFHKAHFVHLVDLDTPPRPEFDRPLRYFYVTGEAQELR
ncbi:MAG: hypothetical protein JWM80_32 [Cyanobacteria bacterium RYN_339]|nr:hypothetical protein [Cyanobacteria bacterium RYN_339]